MGVKNSNYPQSNEGKKSKRGQNEGSIRQRAKNTFEGRITIGKDQDGKQKRVNVYGKTRKEVQEKMREILHQCDTKTYSEPSKLTLSEWLSIWLKDYKEKHLKLNTITTYEQHIRVHINPYLGDKLLKDLDPVEIQQFYNEKWENGRFDEKGGLSPATIKKIHTILHSSLEQAMKNRYIPFNPANTVTLPKIIKSKVKALTVSEQKKFIKALNGEKDEICLKVCLATGLRIGELLSLTWDCVNLEEGKLEVKKSVSTFKSSQQKDAKLTYVVNSPKTESSERTIPLSDSVVALLQKQKLLQAQEKTNSFNLYNYKNLVFSTKLGNYINKRNLLRSMYRVCEKAGIPRYSVHSLRHTFASRLLDAGYNIIIIQELMGHAKPSITLDTYTHTSKESEKVAISNIDWFGDVTNTTE